MKGAVMRGLCMLCAALTLCAATARAEKYALIRGEAGYGGTVVEGAAVPLEITVKATDEAIDGVIGVTVYTSDGKKDIVEQPVFIEGGESVTVRMVVSPGSPQSDFDVRLTDADGGEIAVGYLRASETVEYVWKNLIVGVLGERALDDALAARIYEEENGGTAIVPVHLTAETFMRTAEEMAVWGLLVIDDFDVSTLTDEQQALICRFVRDGGIVLLGAGTQAANSLAWFGALTSVTASGAREETAGVVDALTQYVSLRHDADDAQGVATATLSGGDVLAQAGEKALMTGSRVGQGCVITCGFSLNDPALIEAAKETAIWQRVLQTYDISLYDKAWGRQDASSTNMMGSYTNETILVPTETSILPVAVMLAAYAAVAGLGLYALMRRANRCTLLWAAIPLAAIAFTGAVVLCGGALGLNRPLAVSTRLTMLDEENQMTAEEVVSLAYAGQERVTISAENGEMLRYGSGGYASYDDTSPFERELRNVVRLGDAPYIELEGLATWISRYLRVQSETMPQGSIEASAWFEADGLHVHIENGLDVDLENAVLLTNYGYKRLGDIAAGADAQAALIRGEDWRTDVYKRILIEDGEMGHFNTDMYRVIQLCVDSELALGLDTPISDVEQYEWNMESRRLKFGANYAQGDFPCVLVAETPQLPCAALLADGEAITRTQQTSVLLKRIPVDTAGEIGQPFIPAGEIDAMPCATDANGTPQMRKTSESIGPRRGCFGFAIERIAREDVTKLTFVHVSWDLIAELYDHTAGEWMQMGDSMLTVLEGEEAQRFISPQGACFVRYSAPSEIALTEDRLFDAPAMIVEGRNDA